MASGNTLFTFEPTDYSPPASNYPQPDRRNGIPVLCFDAGTAEVCDFLSFLPRHYGGGGITLAIVWMAATATSGAVQWQVAFERHDPTTDLDADSFATAVAASATTTNASSGNPTTTTLVVPVGNLDSIAPGEHFRMRLTRLVAGSMTGDAQLIGIEGRET